MKLHRSIPLFLLAAALLALSAPFEASAWRGVQKWSYDAGNSVTGSPAAVNGTIVIGDSEGRLVALDKATGELRWTFSAGGTINGTPALLGSSRKQRGAEKSGGPRCLREEPTDPSSPSTGQRDGRSGISPPGKSTPPAPSGHPRRRETAGSTSTAPTARSTPLTPRRETLPGPSTRAVSFALHRSSAAVSCSSGHTKGSSTPLMPEQGKRCGAAEAAAPSAPRRRRTGWSSSEAGTELCSRSKYRV